MKVGQTKLNSFIENVNQEVKIVLKFIKNTNIVILKDKP